MIHNEYLPCGWQYWNCRVNSMDNVVDSPWDIQQNHHPSYPTKPESNYRYMMTSFKETFQRCHLFKINSLWPSDIIWRQRSGSTLAQVMACCLTTPSHYLNQCWLFIGEIQRHSPGRTSWKHDLYNVLWRQCSTLMQNILHKTINNLVWD